MSDGGQATERGGTPIVQPVPGVERLRRLGVGREHGMVRLEHLRHVEPGQHRGDLIAVQRQPVRREPLNPRLLEQVDRSELTLADTQTTDTGVVTVTYHQQQS